MTFKVNLSHPGSWVTVWLSGVFLRKLSEACFPVTSSRERPWSCLLLSGPTPTHVRTHTHARSSSQTSYVKVRSSSSLSLHSCCASFSLSWFPSDLQPIYLLLTLLIFAWLEWCEYRIWRGKGVRPWIKTWWAGLGGAAAQEQGDLPSKLCEILANCGVS